MDLFELGIEHFKKQEAKKLIDNELRQIHEVGTNEILRMGDIHLLTIKWDLICPKRIRKERIEASQKTPIKK